MAEFNTNLKKLRLAKGLTQREVANALEITVQMYSRYENSDQSPSIDRLKQIAEFFRISVDELINPDKNDDFVADPSLLKFTNFLRDQGFQVLFYPHDIVVSLDNITQRYNYGEFYDFVSFVSNSAQLYLLKNDKETKSDYKEEEVEYYPGTDEPTREYMLDFIDREYPTAAFSGGDIHTMNYEELREYYEAVLEEIREEDGE